jgi:hypothetical protein
MDMFDLDQARGKSCFHNRLRPGQPVEAEPEQPSGIISPCGHRMDERQRIILRHQELDGAVSALDFMRHHVAQASAEAGQAEASPGAHHA